MRTAATLKTAAPAPEGTGFDRHTPIDDLPELLTVPEAADAVGVSTGTIYSMVRTGTLRCIRFGRLMRVPREAVRPAGGSTCATESARR